jgi:Peptidase family M23
MANFFVTIRGIVENPSITEINIRLSPSTSGTFLFKAPVGMANLPVIEVAADAEGKNFQNKIYNWLKVTFPSGQTGWARDDLVEVSGDGSAFGYGMVANKTLAFALNRAVLAAPVPAAPPAPVSTASPAAPPAPAAPVPAPRPDVPVAPAAPTVPAGATIAKGLCTAIVIMRDGANARSAPTTTGALVFKAPRDASFKIEQVRQGDGGDTFKWVNGTLQGQKVWMREDVLRYEGDTEFYGLGKPDLYPAPMKNRWWVRGFTGVNPGDHWGWDFGAATGEPIFCGPKGGLVTASVECVKCAGGKSFKNFGIPLSNPSALGDPAWNFGYGHYVIVRYMNEILPESSKQLLAQKGLAGGHLFAMYAHLDSRTVNAGVTLGPNALVGTCGDTGNSEATHLHLEVRASTNPNEAWPNMKKNLLDPVILFGR